VFGIPQPVIDNEELGFGQGLHKAAAAVFSDGFPYIPSLLFVYFVIRRRRRS